MNNLEPQSHKGRVLRTLGFSSSGLGAFGAAHNVCHYTCQAIVALLAIAGISIVGMPLGFLLNPYLIIAFSTIGLVSIALSIILQTRFLKLSGGHLITDKKILIAVIFGVLSIISLISGVNDIRAGQQTTGISNGGVNSSNDTLMVDNPTKTNSEGTVDIAPTFMGLTSEGLLFSVAMDTTDMSASPLAEQYDLREFSYLAFNDKAIIKPVRWDIEETGHMGHHTKGTLIFPLSEKDRTTLSNQTKSFEIIINNVGGIPRRIFIWNIK